MACDVVLLLHTVLTQLATAVNDEEAMMSMQQIMQVGVPPVGRRRSGNGNRYERESSYGCIRGKQVVRKGEKGENASHEAAKYADRHRNGTVGIDEMYRKSIA